MVWTKKDELKIINETQDEYVSELISRINSVTGDDAVLKTINFTSPTGTGKTKMMAKLINKMQDCYFIITSLSKGSLARQVASVLNNDCVNKNYKVYGTQSLTSVSLLTEETILKDIKAHKNLRIIWLRDEGHIKTTNWTKALSVTCEKIVNFSATNKEGAGIVCNFTHTLMLRTVKQSEGSPEDALKKLLEIKKAHARVNNYNPCAIFRVTNKKREDDITPLCEKMGLKYITLIDNDDYIMESLCEDNNEYDVIINKQKIVEGIDIRRAHVIWIENEPANSATTIQLIGRCRRNALLWRNDIDILAPENEDLLAASRVCYAFYNVKKMKVDTDENGELALAFCPFVSCEAIKTGATVNVKNGQMQNGLTVLELMGKSGSFIVKKDEETGFNVVTNQSFYRSIIKQKAKRISLVECGAGLLYGELNENIKIDYSNKIYLIGSTYANGLCHLNFGIASFFKTICFRNAMNEELVSKGIYNYEYTEIKGTKRIMDYFMQMTLENGLRRPKNNRNRTLSELPISYFGEYCFNDREIAIIGCDTMRHNKDGWVEDSSITKKITTDSKFNRFIETRFSNTLQRIKPQLFTVGNSFRFDAYFNSCLGFCAEYYAKYKLWQNDFKEYIDLARKEAEKKRKNGLTITDEMIIVRACVLKYHELMKCVYGLSVAKILPSVSLEKMAAKEKSGFVDAVVFCGERIYNFVKTKIQADKMPNTNLSVNHLSALCDFISKDTIIDVKCTGTINKQYVKQILAYYYLSTKHKDLSIKKLYVYDASTDRNILIDVDQDIY